MRQSIVVGMLAVVFLSVGVEDSRARDFEVEPWQKWTDPAHRTTAMAFRGGRSLAPTGVASWESMVVGGVAAFVADRAEAEVVQWFLDTVLDRLCGDEETRGYFVNACRIDSVYDTVLPSHTALISAFREDLERLPHTLLTSIWGDQGKAVGTAVWSLLSGIRRGKDPIALVAGLAQEEAKEALASACGPDHAAACCLCVTGAVAQLADLRATASYRLDTRTSSDPSSTLTLAEVTGDDNAHFEQTVRECLANFDPPNPPVGSIVKNADRLVDVLVDGAQRLADDIQRINALKRNGAKTREVLEAVLGAANSATDLLEDVGGRLTDIVGGGKFELPAWWEQYLDLAGAVLAGRYSESLRALADILSDSAAAGKIKLPDEVMQVLPLLTDLAAAESAGEVQTALEASAAPAGAWRLKRTRPMVSLGALVGVHAGIEWLHNDDSLARPGVLSGIMAPVGLDISFRACGNHTWGFFLSVIDVGNLATARILDTETETDGAGKESEASVSPEPGFAQVFAPGAFLRWGLGKSPFVLAAGAAWTPELRDYRFTDGTNDNLDSLRFMISLAADIVIIPF